jgi:hypothetical protein
MHGISEKRYEKKSVLFISICIHPVVVLSGHCCYRRDWGKPVDRLYHLALAALLVSLAIYINVSRKRIKPKAAEKAGMMYRFILAIPMMLTAIYLFGIPLRWNVLLIGLGWRFWILSFVMEDITSVLMKRRKEVFAY